MPLEPPPAGLLLGAPEPNVELDAVLEREGYTRRTREYHPVVRCWCGGGFANAPLPHPAFDRYQLSAACGCLLLRHVASNDDGPHSCPPSMARPLDHPILCSGRSLARLRGHGFRIKETVPGLFGLEFAVL